MGAATNVFSYTLTGDSLTIQASQNVVRISILVKQGNVTILGNAQFNGLNSNAVTCSTNQGLSLTAASVANPLDGITITAGGSDIADIILSYQ